jgi:hypothetical protein
MTTMNHQQNTNTLGPNRPLSAHSQKGGAQRAEGLEKTRKRIAGEYNSQTPSLAGEE